MATDPQFPPDEADPEGRFTSDNAKEMGARGAAKREQNLAERSTITREELANYAPAAIESLGEILMREGRDADKLKAIFGILDRIGVGPHSSQDLNVGLSLVEQWAEELDALPPSDDDDMGDGA